MKNIAFDECRASFKDERTEFHEHLRAMAPPPKYPLAVRVTIIGFCLHTAINLN